MPTWERSGAGTMSMMFALPEIRTVMIWLPEKPSKNIEETNFTLTLVYICHARDDYE